MKTKAKSIEECQTLFEIEVTKETLDKAFEDVYDEIIKVANIPGFRVGRAPKELVKKRYEKSAKEEVLKRLIPEAYKRALEDHGIAPITLPEISDVQLEEGKSLIFKARTETRPKFKLKNYKGIRIEKKKIAVKDGDVDKTLDNLREANAKYVGIENRQLQFGDYAVSDLDCFVEGKPIHKKRENLWVYVDKDSITPQLCEKMTGMAKGEERDIDVALPENYPDKTLAGKPARYHISLKEIKMKVLPNLDDEFAKDLNKDSLEILKKEVSKELENRMRLGAEVDMENQLLNKIMDDNVFDVPPSFVARQLSYMVEDAKRRLAEKGFKKDDLDKRGKELAGKFKNDASRQVRLLFILDEIASLEGIKLDDADLNEAYKSISAQTGKSEKEVREYYQEEDLVEGLKEKLKEEKVIKFLLDKAEVVEKD